MRTSTKRALLILVALGAATAGALLGPELYGYYRFEQALDQMVEASSPRGGAWPPLRETCFSCHGANGQSRNGHYPALSGQPVAYLEAQLRAFAEGGRRHPTMEPLARSLTDVSIHEIATYYAAQASGKGEVASDLAALAGRGRVLVASASCQACHGVSLKGQEHAPRIAGQGENYLAGQLQAFKRGDRRDPTGAMNGIAGTLSDEDIPVVARYVASLTP